MQQVRGAELLHRARERDRLGGVVRPSTGDDWDATARLLDGNLDDAPMLLERQRRSLARAAARDQEMNAFGDLPIDERAQRGFVERAVRLERSDHRGAAAVERR